MPRQATRDCRPCVGVLTTTGEETATQVRNCRKGGTRNGLNQERRRQRMAGFQCSPLNTQYYQTVTQKGWIYGTWNDTITTERKRSTWRSLAIFFPVIFFWVKNCCAFSFHLWRFHYFFYQDKVVAKKSPLRMGLHLFWWLALQQGLIP